MISNKEGLMIFSDAAYNIKERDLTGEDDEVGEVGLGFGVMKFCMVSLHLLLVTAETALIHHASHNWGFFQVIHHDIPISVLDNTISAVQSFKELPVQVKTQHYRWEMGSGVSFQTNFDLYRSSAATWRDTLQMRLGPEPPDVSRISEVCRREVMA
ncbi:Oxoglutarate/iron-dependent dioxygenase [Cinnamomum micranthum f. kanehirae]|uniref:Oxoglutarate/iron-dependent dioxygenase n=1 Tax=Cinnamomum micranthum f. kanehirae TaxID=337451 RepID=A0A3S3NLR7_9MAGN|nr:Oxoglutarate/iron-dependent dioxygenase [Cinnamomum micranthum f. kanehirae]